MTAMEILAPVGGREQLLAAVRCGADAVYLGAKGFNARRNAENFEEAGLAEAVSYCHARGVRVHVTVNTLVTDDELPALVETLREVAASGADAVIVQDLAVAQLVQAHCPGIAMHASTQMTIHNAAGARALEGLGFSRAVLARELTLDEIAAIHAASSIELEAFVHGALCMSVSGACYLSAMLGGRSGNRGLCAQPCRLDFGVDGRAFALSLKDLSALAHTDALQKAGICSLKIEGRMKRPEYVAAATTACRQALAGEPYDIQTLEAVFSRGGFTDGYLTGKRNLSMFGIRSKEDVQASQRVIGQLAGLYRRERPAIAVDMHLALYADAPATLVVTDGTHTVTAQGETAQVAQSAATDVERAQRSLSKTGESPFFLRTLSMDNEDGLMLPASAINALRRQALGELLSLREAPEPKAFVEAEPPALPAHQPPPSPALRVRFESKAQLWDGIQAEKIILPIEVIDAETMETYGDRLIGELPALVFPSDEPRVRKTLDALAAQGLTDVLCHNLGMVQMAKDAGMMPHGGYGLNILNAVALERYAKLGLADATVSFELHAQKIRQMAGALPRGAVAYGYLPLMQLRSCPTQGAKGCGTCDGHPYLTDRMGIRFPLLCHRRAYATMLNSVPLSLAGDPLPNVDFITLRYTIETAAECRRITECFMEGKPLDVPRTKGLYHRTLQ